MEELQNFIEELSSKAPVPGGGGASALIGAVAAALCSMVANLTSGKKKYAAYQEDIDNIILKMKEKTDRFLELIKADAEAFYPLSQAYGIPKDTPGRDEIMEKALVDASAVPMDILCEAHSLLDILDELREKGSKLAVSDIGVAATTCRAAAEGAAMNIYVNTRLMNDREYAEELNDRTRGLLSECEDRCNSVYKIIEEQLSAK